MHNKKLNVLIAGAGFMGDVHAKAYKNMKSADIFGIVDKNSARAAAFAGAYGCRQFGDIREALAQDVDFVDVCLPTLYHRDAVLAGFAADKDVICEKPLTLSAEEGEQLAEASEKMGRKFMVAHVVRFWPEYAKLTDMVEKKEIEDIKCVTFSRYCAPPVWSEGNWILSDRKSGGIIYDLAIHDIDYSISLFGMPEWVFAKKCMIGEDFTAYINIILGYKNVNVLIESGEVMSRPYPFTTGFRISNGRISLEYINKSKKGLVIFPEDGTQGFKMEYEDYNPYERELEYFIECIKEDKKPVKGSARDAIKAVKLAGYIEKSSNTGEKVAVI